MGNLVRDGVEGGDERFFKTSFDDEFVVPAGEESGSASAVGLRKEEEE